MNYTYILLGYLLLPLLIGRLLLRSLKNPLYRQRIGERFGFVGKNNAPLIWIHCVSVGEFRAAVALIDALLNAYPKHKIMVSSTTITGSNAIRKHYQNRILHYYFPFDLPHIVMRFINQIQPQICILLETEIWANLINALSKNNIPILLVNARLSQHSFRKYKRFAPKLSRQTLQKLSLIATQNEHSNRLFVQLGAEKNKVITLNNIKFDQNPTPNKNTVSQLQTLIGKRKVVVFASTHQGEEAKIIKSYLHCKNDIDALLIIIPRHPERFDLVFKLLQKQAIVVGRHSNNTVDKNTEILLGDSMGEMMAYFAVCDIAFMGGSLSASGGHNMLEPAALKKPIIFGENVFNFAQIATDLLKQNAAIMVSNADQLWQVIITLLGDKKQCESLGKNAKQYVHDKQGGVKKLLPLIAKNLAKNQ